MNIFPRQRRDSGANRALGKPHWYALLATLLCTISLARAQSPKAKDYASEFVTNDPLAQSAKVFYSGGRVRIEPPSGYLDSTRSEVLISSWHEYETYTLTPKERRFEYNQGPPGPFGLFVPLPDPEHPCATLWSRMALPEPINCERKGTQTLHGRMTVRWTLQVPLMTQRLTLDQRTLAVDVWIDEELGTPIEDNSSFSRTTLKSLQVVPQPAELFAIPSGYRGPSGKTLTQALRPRFDEGTQFNATLTTPEGRSTIYSAQGRVRIVFDSNGVILVADPRNHRTALLDPNTHSIQDAGDSFEPFFEFLHAVNPQDPCADSGQTKTGVTCKRIGTELVAGRFTETWEITRSGSAAGTLWIDPLLSFPIKVVLAGRVFRELQYISEGLQPAELFEIPPDFRNVETRPVPNSPSGNQ